MHTLPLNYAGLALIVFSIILFVLEVKVTSHGILGLGGVIALALGSIMLIRTESALEFIRISWSVILSTTLLTALFFFFLIGMAVKAQKAKPVSGAEGIVGETGQAIARLEPAGMVRVHGELWTAQAVKGIIEEGAMVKVTGIKNLTLYVEQLNDTV
jgi:membrane-bound serine protease (ClpP class)